MQIKVVSTSQKKMSAMVIVTDDRGKKHTRHLRLRLDHIVGVTLPTYDRTTWMEQNDSFDPQVNQYTSCAGISEAIYEPNGGTFGELVPLVLWENLLSKEDHSYLKDRILKG